MSTAIQTPLELALHLPIKHRGSTPLLLGLLPSLLIHISSGHPDQRKGHLEAQLLCKDCGAPILSQNISLQKAAAEP